MGQALLAVAHLLGLLAAPAEPASMFPPGSLSHEPAEHELRSAWYSRILGRLGERSLAEEIPGSEAYRVTQVPAFSATRLVRVERRFGEAGAIVTWKTGPPAEGGAAAGPPDGSRRLTAAEWQGLVERVAAAVFWSRAPDDSRLGLDGVTYLLEGQRPGLYRAAHRWSPRDGTFRRLCRYLLALARPEASPPPPTVVDPRDRRPSAFGRIVARVSEARSGKALPGVIGTVQGGGVLEDRQTDGSGRFTVADLVPGLYAVRWERPGHPVDRLETQAATGIRAEWDEVVPVAAGQTVCVNVAYGRAPGGEPGDPHRLPCALTDATLTASAG